MIRLLDEGLLVGSSGPVGWIRPGGATMRPEAEHQLDNSTWTSVYVTSNYAPPHKPQTNTAQCKERTPPTRSDCKIYDVGCHVRSFCDRFNTLLTPTCAFSLLEPDDALLPYKPQLGRHTQEPPQTELLRVSVNVSHFLNHFSS